MNWISVTEAAHALDRTPRQVRRLAASGQLDAQRIGGIWAVDADAVRCRMRADISAGRPLSETASWAVLCALEDVLVGGDAQLPAWLSAQQRWRLNSALSQRPPASRWPHWTRRRSEPQRLRVLPRVVHHMVGDPRVRCVDADVASLLGLTLPHETHLYVDAVDAAEVTAAWRATPSVDGHVVLHTVHFDIAALEELPLVAAEVIGGIDSGDPRVKAASRDATEDAIARLAAL